VPLDQVDLVVLAVLPVPELLVETAERLDQAEHQDLPAQDSVPRDPVGLEDLVQVHLADVLVLADEVVVELELPVHSVRVDPRANLASPSAPRRKSSNKEKHRA
jgi:hypothetical protein